MSGKVIALVNPGMVTQSVADRLLKAIASKNIPLFVDSDEAKHGIRALNRKESIVQKISSTSSKIISTSSSFGYTPPVSYESFESAYSSLNDAQKLAVTLSTGLLQS